MKARWRSAHVGVGGVILACIAGGCPGTAPNTSPPDLTGQVRYGFDIQPIFDKHCNSCHRDGGAAERLGIPLHLTSGQAYDYLREGRSTKNADWPFVVPGDPGASLLYRKVADAFPPVGTRMPFMRPPLSSEEIELIRRWIADGAPAN